MIYKVLYQPTRTESPKRENTKSMYIDAENEVSVRALVQSKDPAFNVEFVEALTPEHLAYEKQNPDFKLTEF